MKVVAESHKGKVASFTGGNDRPSVSEAFSLTKRRLGWWPDRGVIASGKDGSYVWVKKEQQL